MKSFICQSRFFFIFITAIFVCLIYSFLFTPLASATALIQVVRTGDTKTLNSMLDKGANISNIEGGWATVLETVIDYNHIEVEKNQAYIL